MYHQLTVALRASLLLTSHFLVETFDLIDRRVLPDVLCSDHRLIVYEFLPRLTQGFIHNNYDFRHKTKGANWDFFSSLFARHARDCTRNDLSPETCAELMSATFTYCADVAVGRGSVTNTRRYDWWNEYLVHLRRIFRRARRRFNRLKKRVTGDTFTSAFNELKIARSHYRAAVQKSKGNLLRKIAARLDKEGPCSPLYQEFKANRPIRLSYIDNIKFNNSYTTSIEETTEALLHSLIPDDIINDNNYHNQIRMWAAELPNSAVSNLATLDEFITIVASLRLNKASGEDKVSNKMIKEACKSAADSLLSVFNRCIAEGIFPRIWRSGFIRIIPKSGDKAPNDPKS
ncbi:hypothetical protein O3G_MSEX013504 [Manduca sexta]|uniref:Reverse transcriptase n=1 Tax=Manduca sexta TaxID=7130 RepID=A0A921ZSE2_MANSE|nr:hypothetical protein O3G_MSEX013504 [Manduca sexta]